MSKLIGINFTGYDVGDFTVHDIHEGKSIAEAHMEYGAVYEASSLRVGEYLEVSNSRLLDSYKILAREMAADIADKSDLIDMLCMDKEVLSDKIRTLEIMMSDMKGDII